MLPLNTIIDCFYLLLYPFFVFILITYIGGSVDEIDRNWKIQSRSTGCKDLYKQKRNNQRDEKTQHNHDGAAEWN